MATVTPTPRQGLLGGVIVTLVAEGIALPAGLITAMVMTRGLGPEIYGRFTVVATTLAITEWLLIAVLARAVVKFVAEADDWRPVAGTSFRMYALSGLAIGAAFWALAGPIAAVLDDPILAGYFRLFAVQIPIFAAGAAGRNVLAGQARYREQAMASAVGWTGRVVFIVLFIQLGFGIEGAILGSVCGTLAGTVTAVALVGGALWGPGGLPVRQLLQLALPAFLAMLAARLLDQVGLIALQVLTDVEAEVGYYGAAMNVLLVTGVVGAAVTPVLISTVTAARYRDDREQVQLASTGAIRFGLALFPFAAIIAGASLELSTLLFGPDFQAAAGPMAALIVAAVARANIVIVSAVLIAVDRAWTSALIALPLPLVALAAQALVIPAYGGLGAAVVTMSVALAAAVVSVLVARRAIGAPAPVATVLRSAVLSALGYLLALGWATPGFFVLLKLGVLSAGILGAFLMSGELSAQELRTLGNTVLTGRRTPPARPRMPGPR